MIVAHVVVLNGLYNAHILWTITKFLSIFETLNYYKIWVVVDDMLLVLPPCEVICIYI